MIGVISGGFMYQSYVTSVEVLGKVRIIPDEYEAPPEMTADHDREDSPNCVNTRIIVYVFEEP